MTIRFTDEEDYYDQLRFAVEQAAELEDCLECRKCQKILDIIQDASEQAQEALCRVDPEDKNKIIALQQISKVWRTLHQALNTAINNGNNAVAEIKDLEEMYG